MGRMSRQAQGTSAEHSAETWAWGGTVRRRWLTRTALTVGMGLIIWVAISMTAQAEADDGISPAQVATDCTHGGPYKDQDVWVFDTTKATPSDATNANPNAMSGDIANTGPNDPTRTGLQGAELSATFEGPHGPSQTKKINSRVYDLEGHSIAWTSAPAGWRLVATIPADLRLVGTCQAERVGEAIGINPTAALTEPAKANAGPATV